jgi:hypothetical protein
MTKIADKWKLNYSLATLRDALFASLANDDYIVYNSTNQKWENKKQPRFGRDFKEQTKSTPNGQSITGNQFVTYDTINFDVAGPDLVNKYRVSIDFVINHNAAGNDFRARLIIDNNQVGEEMRVEPKDPGADQRPHYNLKWFPTNLSVGSHEARLEVRPASQNRITSVYQSITEIWRVS